MDAKKKASLEAGEDDEEEEIVELREGAYGGLTKVGNDIKLALKWLLTQRSMEGKGDVQAEYGTTRFEGDMSELGMGSVLAAMRRKREQAVKSLSDQAGVRVGVERAR